MWAFHPAVIVNGHLLPFERQTARVLDFFSLANLEDEDAEVHVVNIGSNSKLRWLVSPTAAIKGPDNWWPSNTKNIPLLCEIRNMVRKGRRLLPAMERGGQRNLMFVEVRGVTLLVGNLVSAVSLAFKGNAGMGGGAFEKTKSVLGWFLVELSKDIKALLETRRERLNSCGPEVHSPKKLKTIKEVKVAPPKKRKTIKEFKVRFSKKRKNINEFKLPSPKKKKT